MKTSVSFQYLLAAFGAFSKPYVVSAATVPMVEVCTDFDVSSLSGCVGGIKNQDNLQEGEVLCEALKEECSDEDECHPSCKACNNRGGYADGCITCADSSLEPVWGWYPRYHSDENFPYGYCDVAPCQGQIEALETCLSANAENCPSVEYLIEAKEPKFPFGNGRNPYYNEDASFPEGFIETDATMSNYEISQIFYSVQDHLCNPIVALVDGLTLTQGGYPDCPCATQLYEQLYCFERERIEMFANDGRLFRGNPIEVTLPPTSSNPREDVCGIYSIPSCTTDDVDPEMVGCLTPQCTIIPECQCVRQCKTCGWWNSLEEVNFYNDGKKAGDPGTQCTSCHGKRELTGEWGGMNGSGHCWGSSAPSTSVTAGAMISAMATAVFLSLSYW